MEAGRQVSSMARRRLMAGAFLTGMRGGFYQMGKLLWLFPEKLGIVSGSDECVHSGGATVLEP